MNERINGLWWKARIGYNEQNCDPEVLAKFAELIVRECASQVRFTDLLKCNDDSDGEILLQASVQLKEHFGVEE